MRPRSSWLNTGGIHGPKMMFLTKGVGVDKNRLSSFELALRNAGIEQFNLVYVSSILPPLCKIVPRSEGLRHLEPGEIVYCVMARNETDEPNRLISASIGLAMPKDRKQYGYLSEHHTFGQTAEIAGDYAEDLAATMLASALWTRLARLSSSRDSLYCGLWVPGGRAEPFFPLRSRRSSGLTRPGNAAQVPPSGFARYAWSGITPGPLLPFDKPSHGFCSDNSRVVPFVDRPFYNTVVLTGCGKIDWQRVFVSVVHR